MPEAPEVHSGPDTTIDFTAVTHGLIVAIVATVITVTIIVAIVIVTKRYKAHRAKVKARTVARDAQITAITRDIDYARKHITAVSEQYAQAHTDPEYVLYNPLILSSADCVYEFNDKLMRARATLEECEHLLTRDKPTDLEFIETAGLRSLADLLDREWNDLNRKAERIGTPLFYAGQLRRAETLWSISTNEAATVHERQRTMDKLHNIVADYRNTLTTEGEKKQNTQLFDAMNHVITSGKNAVSSLRRNR